MKAKSWEGMIAGLISSGCHGRSWWEIHPRISWSTVRQDATRCAHRKRGVKWHRCDAFRRYAVFKKSEIRRRRRKEKEKKRKRKKKWMKGRGKSLCAKISATAKHETRGLYLRLVIIASPGTNKGRSPPGEERSLFSFSLLSRRSLSSTSKRFSLKLGLP